MVFLKRAIGEFSKKMKTMFDKIDILFNYHKKIEEDMKYLKDIEETILKQNETILSELKEMKKTTFDIINSTKPLKVVKTTASKAKA